MTYEKPELEVLAASVQAIQGSGKIGETLEAGVSTSTSAYEADE